jgi:hypothetical protein
MKVKGARLLKPTTDSRAALMLSPMTTTTVTGRRHAAPVVASAPGLGVPIAAIFYPWLRACRVSLFLPANAMVPLAIGAMFFKVVDRLEQGHHVGKLLDRPSETYLYVFIVAYLVIYARRIRELEAVEGAPK